MPLMQRDSRIYVAGHRGLAGSALLRQLQARDYRSLIVRSHAELDLSDQAAVARFFAEERPQFVFLAAAKVGGILANASYPADFIWQNLSIQSHIIHAAWQNGVERLLFLGSSCIYPRDCAQPMREEYLLSGPLEATNRPYAVAKIAGIEMCWSYNRQYGTRFIAAMPTNLYGPGDNYDLDASHVLPALLRKMHEAKLSGAAEVVVWGSGRPRREFLHSDDMAAACVHLLELPEAALAELLRSDAPPLVNIGCGEDLSILELAQMLRETVGYGGRLAFDASKPDGTPRKLLDTSKLKALGWQARISLRQGCALAYADYLRSR